MIVQSTDRNCFRADVVDPVCGPVLMGSDSESVVSALRCLLAATTRLLDESDRSDEPRHEADHTQDESGAGNGIEVGDKEEGGEEEVDNESPRNPQPGGDVREREERLEGRSEGNEGVWDSSRNIERRWSF